jgi:lipoyl(octanoyl) transferase
VWLGRRPYEPLHELQQQLVTARGEGRVADLVLLLEHEPVITLGRNAKREHLLATSSPRSSRAVPVVQTGRGGDVTYHGPGQLVGYPIIDLKPHRCDVRRYVRCLAEVMIRLASRHGVAAGEAERLIGVWADAAVPATWSGLQRATRPVKIGAIGVRLSNWVSMHGFALNLATDLSAFELIVPCGISQYGVASVGSLTGKPLDVAEVALQSASTLSAGLELDIETVEDRSAVADLATLLLPPAAG